MAHGTRAHLHVALPDVLPTAVLAAVVLVDGVVGLNCEDLAVFDVALQNTCRVPAAVCRAGRVEDALAFASGAAGIDDGLFVHQLLLVVSSCRNIARRGQRVYVDEESDRNRACSRANLLRIAAERRPPRCESVGCGAMRAPSGSPTCCTPPCDFFSIGSLNWGFICHSPTRCTSCLTRG